VHKVYTYDAWGRLASKTGCCGSGGTTTYAYDTVGKIIATDCLTNTTTYWFNDLGLLAKTQDPLGRVTARTYDNLRQLVEVTDPAGRDKTYIYDSQGNRASETDQLGYTTRYSYTGPYNHLASFLDANGNSTRYNYETDGDLSSVLNAANAAEVWTYDAQGNRLSWQNRRGQTVTYTNDSLGQLIARRYPDGILHTFNYDSRGNLTNYTDATGSTSQQFDANDRLTKITYPGGYWLSYTYDVAGRRASMLDQLGHRTDYHFGADGRLQSLTDENSALIVQYNYNTAGQITNKMLGNGVYTTYAYDAAGQLLELANRKPDTSILSRFVYAYDERDRRTTMTTTYGAGDPRTSLAGLWIYDYDDSGQLIGWTAPNGRQVGYHYDALGNRLSVNDGGTNTVYTVNTLNRYTQVGSTVYQYDADGNVTNKVAVSGTNTFAWTADNKLSGLVGPGLSWQNLYDALGNRRRVLNNGVSTDYVVDQSGLGSVVGAYAADTSLITRYIHGLGLVSREGAVGQSGFYTFDALGTTSELIDNSGSISNAYGYLPFGELLFDSEAIYDGFQFVGNSGVMAASAGLNFMRARHYDAQAGRFISPDPIGFTKSGDVNLYRYGLNNPVSRIDPSGFESFQQCYKDCVDRYTPSPVGELCAALFLACRMGNWPACITFGDACGAYSFGTYIGCALGCGVPLPPPLPPPQPCTQYPGMCYCFPIPYSTYQNCVPIPPTPPQDPNGLVGPNGYGSQSYVSITSLLPYRINFENATNALVPAQVVSVSNQLSANLDLSTFALASIGFGNQFFQIPANSQHYQQTVHMTYHAVAFDVQIEAGINLANGVVYANFRSIVPATGLPPTVDIGFLPPEDGTGRGDGFMAYTVNPKTMLPTGTEVRNVAWITFDQNPAIATDLVDPHNPSSGHDTNKQALVTIDASLPTSSVIPLLATATNTAFTVSWSGSDTGSGVVSYDIYVQTNSGPWTLWLAGTTATSATFYGQGGQTYGFYSIAHDGAGNTQPAPSSANTTTTTLSNYPPVITPVTNRVAIVGGQLVITNQAYDPNGVTFSLGAGAPTGASITANGVFTWTPACGQGSTTNPITIWATDHGNPPLSSSITFTSTVPECIQASIGSTVMQTGQTSSVPVVLLSTTALTNMVFVVPFPPDRLTNFAITVNSAQVLTQSLQLLDKGDVQVSFILPAGSVLHGPTNVGVLSFAALANQSSVFLPLPLISVSGQKPDGGPVANAYGQPGRVVIIGKEPLLEAALGTNAQRLLTLYGNPGATYQMGSSTNLMRTNWAPVWHFPMTNLSEVFSADQKSPLLFYRAWEFSANPPMLELNSSAPTNLVLLVYGQKGSNYVIVTGTNLAAPNNWSSMVGFTMTNSFQFIEAGAATNQMKFFRAERP
jgi:RHS repeat-associated protein